MKSRLAQAAILSTMIASIFTFASEASSKPCIYGNSGGSTTSIPSDSPSGPAVGSVDASNSSFTSDNSSITDGASSVDGSSNVNRASAIAGLFAIMGIGVGGTILLKTRRVRNLDDNPVEDANVELFPEDDFTTSDFVIIVSAEALTRSEIVEELGGSSKDAALLVRS